MDVDAGTFKTLKDIAAGNGKVNNRGNKTQEYLEAILRELGIATGSVCSVLVNSTTGIRCYGRHIKDGIIFRQLNKTIERGFIGYPNIEDIRSWEQGYFVRAAEFDTEDPESPGDWVALINIPIPDAMLEQVVQFQQRPLV